LNHDFPAEGQPHEHQNREPVFAFPVKLIIEVHIHEMKTVVNDTQLKSNEADKERWLNSLGYSYSKLAYVHRIRVVQRT
jgi:hypothetical protein